MDDVDRNFHDMLGTLRRHGAEFLVVGAHSLRAHDAPRATGDLDIWVRPTPQNAPKVWRALDEFGAALSDAKEEDFASPRFGLHLGVPPGRIVFLTTLSGLEFDEAWAERVPASVCGVPVAVLGLKSLIKNKMSAGREKDLLDVKRLQKRNPAIGLDDSTS
jgi:hypothetical protein